MIIILLNINFFANLIINYAVLSVYVNLKIKATVSMAIAIFVFWKILKILKKKN